MVFDHRIEAGFLIEAAAKIEVRPMARVLKIFEPQKLLLRKAVFVDLAAVKNHVAEGFLQKAAKWFDFFGVGEVGERLDFLPVLFIGIQKSHFRNVNFEAQKVGLACSGLLAFVIKFYGVLLPFHHFTEVGPSLIYRRKRVFAHANEAAQKVAHGAGQKDIQTKFDVSERGAARVDAEIIGQFLSRSATVGKLKLARVFAERKFLERAAHGERFERGGIGRRGDFEKKAVALGSHRFGQNFARAFKSRELERQIGAAQPFFAVNSEAVNFETVEQKRAVFLGVHGLARSAHVAPNGQKAVGGRRGAARCFAQIRF